MLTKTQNAALLQVGKLAEENPAWLEYAAYCFQREKGLRDEAFAHLEKFLTASEDWLQTEKIAFTKFLFPLMETVLDADYGPCPQPLSDRFLKPTLAQWCAKETTDSTPFRWYGKHFRSQEHILQALAINPADDQARETLLSWWLASLSYATHHLPAGYIGDPAEDILFAAEIQKQIAALAAPARQQYWQKELDAELELIENYREWQQSGRPNFEAWGLENKKNTSNGINRVYHYKKA